MTEIIIAAVVGLVVGVGGTVGIIQISKPKTQPVANENIAKEQQEVIKQLTNLDLVMPVCDPKYIETHTDILCRELTCLQFSRGIDSKTSANQCESISNVANKKSLISFCATQEDYTECLEVFWRRN